MPKGRKQAPQGSVTEKTIKGYIWLYIKQGDKWVAWKKKEGQPPSPVGRKKLPEEQRIAQRAESLRKAANKVAKAKNEERLKRIEAKQQKKQEELNKREALRVYKEQKQKKVQEKALPTRVRDESLYKSVQVAKGTIIRALKTEQDEDVIERWYKKMEARNNALWPSTTRSKEQSK